MAAFKLTDLQRAIKAGQALGLTVRGYEIGSDGRIVVHTNSDSESSADAALDQWVRSQRGKA